MPGTATELTTRLEPARRQFFQWHFVEKRHMLEVKEKMDQLTLDLNIAGHVVDFVAEVNAWKGRSRHWNSLSKSAWKIDPPQKGRGLPVPLEAQGATLWIKWDQDVGDWRREHVRLNAAQAYGRGYPSQVTGNYDGHDERSTMMQAQDGFDDSHDLLDSSDGLTHAHTANPTEISRAFQTGIDVGRAQERQESRNSFANIHPPMVPLLDQNMDRHEMTLPPFNRAPDPLDNHPSGLDLWNATYMTATIASGARLDRGYDHNPTPHANAFEASRITLPNRFATAPRSDFRGHGYQDVHGPHSWNAGSFYQHQHQHQHLYHQSDTSATHRTPFDGQPRTAHQEEGPK